MLKFGNTYLNYNGTYLSGYTKYEPDVIRGNTLRFKFTDDSYDPKTETNNLGTYWVWTQVSSNPNIWDLTCINEIPSWEAAFSKGVRPEYVNCNQFNDLNGTFEIIGYGDELNLYCAYDMFNNQTKLTKCITFPLNTLTYAHGSTVGYMFYNCTGLTELPKFDWTVIVTNHIDVGCLFTGCVNVTTGIIDNYNSLVASNKAIVPSYSEYKPFKNCGINTQTGAAELEQIPSDWK